MQILAGSPRLLRNINEKAVLQHLLRDGSLTRMELEAFTGLSKPAVSDLLRRLEAAGLIRRNGARVGAYGPAAGLWALEPRACHVAGVSVSAHTIDAAVADVTGRVVASLVEPCEADQVYDAGAVLLKVLEEVTAAAGLVVKDLNQVVVGLAGIVDSETGHLRRGRQLPAWEGFDIPNALREALGHRCVRVENDVNLVAIEEMSRGAAVGVQSVILFWLGEGVGGALVLGGKLIRGSTGSAGELGGALVPDRRTDGAPPATVEDLLSSAAIGRLLREHDFAAEDIGRDLRIAGQDLHQHGKLIDELAYRVAAALAGAIGIIDPDIVVLAGDIGIAGGRALAQRVVATLSALPIAVPQVVPSAVGDHAVRAGAVELALEYAREQLFTGGTAARGLP
jgi:predicted NBD/HSP70 family sugar kinase